MKVFSSTLALTFISNDISADSLFIVSDYDLMPQSMKTAEPTPVPTKRPSVEVEPTHWGQSSPAPADAPNTVRRLQLWTCCKPDPTETTEEHVNSKLTHEPTDEPTPRPTVPVDNGMSSCSSSIITCDYTVYIPCAQRECFHFIICTLEHGDTH